jgi:hypothetical protein
MQKAKLLPAFALVLLGAGVVWAWVSGGAADLEPTIFSANDLLADPQPAAADAEMTTRPTNGDPALERVAVEIENVEPGAARAQVRICGRVVDAAGGAVAGAAVRLALHHRSANGAAAAVSHVTTPSTTAGDGRFAFLGPRLPVIAITLGIHAPAHAPLVVRRETSLDLEVQDVGDIRLLRGGDLVGQVGDLQAKGLPDAEVLLQPSSGSPLLLFRQRGEFLKPQRTDAGGFFRFAHLLPGRYRVRASAAGMQAGSSSTVHVEEGQELRIEVIRLAPGTDLHGSVLGSADQPIAGAEVRAHGVRGATATNGAFHLEHLPPGPLRVQVRAPGFLFWQRQDVDPAQRLVVRLEPGLRLTGMVVDATAGAPIERFALVARRSHSLQEPTSAHPPSNSPARSCAARRAGFRRQDERRESAGPEFIFVSCRFPLAQVECPLYKVDTSQGDLK